MSAGPTIASRETISPLHFGEIGNVAVHPLPADSLSGAYDMQAIYETLQRKVETAARNETYFGFRSIAR